MVINKLKIDILRFADDIAIIAESKENLKISQKQWKRSWKVNST